MNFWSSLLGIIGKAKNNIQYRVGTQLQNIETNGVTGNPDKIGTLFTCFRILSENLSRMPLSVFSDTPETGLQELKRHRLTYLLKHRPNPYQNAQQFWSTVEYHRNRYGNAIVKQYFNRYSGYIESLEILHPGLIKDYKFSGGQLFYEILNPETQQGEWESYADLLHFRNISEDGIFGLSTLVAIERQANINERATKTIDKFYQNNATTPGALETDMPGNLTGPAYEALTATKGTFQEQYAGPDNAGKWIHLPIGTKYKPIAMQFADAKLIETLRFTREDISAAYGIPLFMVDGSAEKLDVEQLTTLFKNNTMGPIVSTYMAEINNKMLTRRELETGVSVMFDVMSLIGMDYQTMVMGIKEQVVNGLMTPNEGARKLGNKPIDAEHGNKHFMQAQYIPLEDFTMFNPLQKTDPTLKTK